MFDDANSAKRCKCLGDIGERITPSLLVKAGFQKIIDLNRISVNYPYADFRAERHGTRYVISVKTRNKWERSDPPRRNARYKLGSECLRLAAEAERREVAIAAWVAIAVDDCTLDAYFGTLELLTRLGWNGKGIPMMPEHTVHYECLAQSAPHGFNYERLNNRR